MGPFPEWGWNQEGPVLAPAFRSVKAGSLPHAVCKAGSLGRFAGTDAFVFQIREAREFVNPRTGDRTVESF